MEVVAFAHLRSYPSFPRQANSSLIAVEWNVARHTWVTSCLLRRHCFCRVQYPYFMNMLAWPNVALYFLIFIGSLFPLLVIKRCDTSQLKFKVCIYMNVYFRKSAATFDYLFLMTHEQKYCFFTLCINIGYVSVLLFCGGKNENTGVRPCLTFILYSLCDSGQASWYSWSCVLTSTLDIFV